MAAPTADRDTISRSGSKRTVPVKANTTIYAGSMVAVDNDGWGKPASTTQTDKVIGRAADTIKNEGGNGAMWIDVQTGIFHFANSSNAEAVTRADVNDPCRVIDAATVAKDKGNSDNRAVAGLVFDVDAQGVWVTF